MVRNTPDQLIIKSVPWAMAIMIAATILALSGVSIYGFLTGNYLQGTIMFLAGPVFMGLFFVIFVRRDDLILDRTRNKIELRHATVFGRKTVIHALTDLEDAIVQTQKANRNSSHSNNVPTHRLALVLSSGMDAGTHPVTENYMSGNGAQRAADVINAWLAMNVDSASKQA